jgi:hypothetical protein
MALTTQVVPRGLEDLKVALLTGDTPGSNVDVYGSKSISWDVESDSDEQTGDNTTIAIVRLPKRLTGSITIGSVPLAALAVMVGGSVVPSGTGTTELNTLDESASAGSTYFQATATTFNRAVSGEGYQVNLKKLLVTSGPAEELSGDAWDEPSLDFEGVAISGVLLSRVQQETYAAAA